MARENNETPEQSAVKPAEPDTNTSEEAAYDPFSPELALKTCRENREASERLVGEIREGLKNGADQKELLLKATEVIGRMTNNTILKSLVEKALAGRETEEPKETEKMPAEEV